MLKRELEVLGMPQLFFPSSGIIQIHQAKRGLEQRSRRKQGSSRYPSESDQVDAEGLCCPSEKDLSVFRGERGHGLHITGCKGST